MDNLLNSFYSLLYRLGIEKGHDKILHAIVGFIVGVISHLTIDGIAMVLPVIIVAAGKELYDQLVKETKFDFFDFFATIFGGALGIMAVGLL